MKITVLNGANELDDLRKYTAELEMALQKSGSEVFLFHLEDMDIRFCTGCWNCWWKTPGKCVFSDDMETILPKMIHSDLVVMVSPVHLGMTSSVLKKTLDRTIPLLHPYMTFIEGETHHKKRYKNYPDIAFIYKKDNRADDEDISFLKSWLNRFKLNFYADLKYFGNTDSDMEEMICEISRT